MDLGSHAAFIWSSYAAVVLILGLLVLWLAADGRKQQRRLDALETRGVRRRSAGRSSAPDKSVGSS